MFRTRFVQTHVKNLTLKISIKNCKTFSSCIYIKNIIKAGERMAVWKNIKHKRGSQTIQVLIVLAAFSIIVVGIFTVLQPAIYSSREFTISGIEQDVILKDY